MIDLGKACGQLAAAGARRGDDDEGLSYAQYFVKDPSIGEEEYYAVYELKEDGELLMDGVAYKRAG